MLGLDLGPRDGNVAQAGKPVRALAKDRLAASVALVEHDVEHVVEGGDQEENDVRLPGVRAACPEKQLLVRAVARHAGVDDLD